MAYIWRTFGNSRVHHVAEEGTITDTPLCESSSSTTIHAPGDVVKCIGCLKLVCTLKDKPKFEDVE